LSYFIGVDEAGYGPRLGPLVVTVSAWHVPSSPVDCDLYELTRKAIAGPDDPPSAGDGRLWIADSKLVYNRQQGVIGLEQAVLPLLQLLHGPVRYWSELCQFLAPEVLQIQSSMPWQSDFEISLPVLLEPEALSERTEFLSAGLRECRVRLVDVRSRVIFPERFNSLVDRCGNKATALSDATIELLAETIAALDDGPVFAVCDKHGGRNFYTGILQHHFPDGLIRVQWEGRAESRYRFQWGNREIQVAFRRGGESCMPTAFSSLVSKYQRELAMMAWNSFWCGRLPGLKPTAGYGNDANRFDQEIRALSDELKIDRRLLWRTR